jgi:hypothetical protein
MENRQTLVGAMILGFALGAFFVWDLGWLAAFGFDRG